MARKSTGEFGLEGIFDNVRDGLVLVRFPQRKIVLFNRSASEITGIPIAEAIGTSLAQVFDAAEVHETARLCSLEPVGVWPGHAQEVLQTQIKGPDGQMQGVELHFCRVDDVGLGGPLVLLVMRPSGDTTLVQARMKSEAAQQRVEVLEGKARDMALFFSEAAHEFNTPLTIVLLQSQLLQQSLGPLDPLQEQALARIDTNVHRLVLLSQDLLDLARADAGRLLLKVVEVDLADLVQREVRNFQDLAKEQGITLAAAAPPGRVPVEAEPRRLRQVLANFIGNALKFTPAGGRVEVRMEARGGQGWVAVKDDGPGMAAEDLERLFKPFVRVQDPDRPKKPGSGLGLYLSKRIVEAHGGDVQATSPGLGQGMEFRFGVPLAKAARPGEDSKQRQQSRRRVGSRQRQDSSETARLGGKARTHSAQGAERQTLAETAEQARGHQGRVG